MSGPEVISLNGALYFREDMVAHHVAGYRWEAVPVNVHKEPPESGHEAETCTTPCLNCGGKFVLSLPPTCNGCDLTPAGAYKASRVSRHDPGSIKG